MKQIFKYELEPQSVTTLHVPNTFKVLSCGAIDGNLFVWIETFPSHKMTPVDFHVVATGETFDHNLTFLGTTLMNTNELVVWHIYYE